MDGASADKTTAPRLRCVLRGMMSLATLGIVITTILLASMGGSAWWAARTQWADGRRARIDQVCAAGEILAHSTEAMLAGDQLTAVRRIVAETALHYDLSRCRIVLPSGGIVADAVPGNITVRELPTTWRGAASTSETRAAGQGQIARAFPLLILGRGNARLEIAASTWPAGMSYWPTQAGIGAITIAALVVLLVLHRLIRSPLRGLLAIRQSLLERRGGQTAPESLEVNPEWGPEAEAWNALLDQAEQQRMQIARDKTADTLRSQGRANGDLHAACDALWQGLILVDENMQARYANGAAAVLLQTKRQEMLGAEVCTFIQDPRVLEAVRAATAAPMQRRTIVEVNREGAGGGVLRFIVRPVRREDRGVSMIIIEDVTQQRVAEESRNAFVAQATHELRTPLTNIRLYVDMALEQGEKNPATRAKCLNVINQEAGRLDRMVGDILSVAEIEAGTLKLKKDDVRLDELFEELAADYAAQAQERQIELTFDLPPKLPVIQGDRSKLALGLHNLLGNALKYTPAGGTVRVTVSAESGRLVTDVSDTGIGIAEGDRSRIFEKFYRSQDRRVAETSGSGLGLAIAREVVRLHGGEISVHSEPDKGSTFTLTLPLAQEAA